MATVATCPQCGKSYIRGKPEWETCLDCEVKGPPKYPGGAEPQGDTWWAEAIRESNERKRRAREAVEAGDRDLARRILEKREDDR